MVRPSRKGLLSLKDLRTMFPESLEKEPSRLKDTRVKVVVTMATGLRESSSREAQDELREKLLAGTRQS